MRLHEVFRFRFLTPTIAPIKLVYTVYVCNSSIFGLPNSFDSLHLLFALLIAKHTHKQTNNMIKTKEETATTQHDDGNDEYERYMNKKIFYLRRPRRRRRRHSLLSILINQKKSSQTRIASFWLCCCFCMLCWSCHSVFCSCYWWLWWCSERKREQNTLQVCFYSVFRLFSRLFFSFFFI